MKCLVRVLGLYDVFHPKAHWKCAWCHVDANKIADFSINKWSLRDIAKMQEMGKKLNGKSEATRKSHAAANYGIKSEPVLQFVLEQVVPCFLHITMGLTRMLLNRLAEEADQNPKLAAELVQRLESKTIALKLVPEEKEKGKTRKFSKRLEKSRIQRPECLRIIEHQEYLLGALDLYSKGDKEHVTQVCVYCYKYQAHHL